MRTSLLCTIPPAIVFLLASVPVEAQGPFAVTNLTPSTVGANSGNFNLSVTVTQASFTNETSRALMFGNTQVTTVPKTTQFSVNVPNNLIATAQLIPVYVRVFTSGVGALPMDSSPMVLTVTAPPPATPQISSLTPASHAANSGNFTLTINGSNFAAGNQIVFGSSTLSPSNITSSQITVTVTNNLIQTAGTVAVHVLAGNVSSNTVNFTVTAPPPATPQISSLTPASVAANSGNFTLTINGSNFASGNQVVFSSSTLSPSNITSSQITVTVTNSLIQTAGTIAVHVQAGNVSSNTVNLTVTAAPPATPQISSLTPANVAANSGNFTLTINGSNFASGNQVVFGSSTLPPSNITSSQITVTVTNSLIQTAGTIAVHVQAGNVSSNAVNFAVTAPPPATPQISTLTPASIAANSGNFTLTINGSNFGSGNQVVFGSSTLSPSNISSSQLTVAVTNSLIQTAGTIAVHVQAGSVSSNTVNFTVTTSGGTTGPVITSINPSSVVANSGTFTLTITGSGFATGIQVFFGNTTISTISVTSSQVTASVPSSLIQTAGVIPLHVQVGNSASPSLSFTVQSTGGTGTVLTSLNPSAVVVNSGTFTLTINGSGFVSGSQVVFGSSTLSPLSLSSTQITTSINNTLIQNAGTIQVHVQSGSNASNSLPFTVEPLGGGSTSALLVTVAGLTTAGSSVNIGAALTAAAPATLTGRIDSTFVSNASGVASNYRDPAQQFVSGGTSITFTIPQGQTAAIFPNNGTLNLGSVAGNLSLTLASMTSGGQSVPFTQVTYPLTVARTAPVIVPNSVQIVNTSGGFNVVLQGYSSTRDVQSAALQFNLSSNAQSSSGTSFTANVGSPFTTWFNSTAGQANGSRFSLAIPFTISGDPNLIRSVSITLTNTAGASGAVSGTH